MSETIAPELIIWFIYGNHYTLFYTMLAVLKLYRYKNFYYWISVATILIMFVLLSSHSYIEKLVKLSLMIEPGSWQGWGAAYFISFTISSAFYTGAVKLFKSIMTIGPSTKSLLFGNYYLEGSWIGFLESKSGISYIVERISQNMDELRVEGRSFRLNDGRLFEKCSWESTIMEIQHDKNRFYYAYINRDNPEIIPNQNPDPSVGQKTSDPVPPATYRGFATFKIYAGSTKYNKFIKELKSPGKPNRSFAMRGSLQDFQLNKPRTHVDEVKVSNSMEFPAKQSHYSGNLSRSVDWY